MTFRYPTRPLHSVQDELDRLYEHAPAGDRPLFPFSMTSPSTITPAGTARGQHSAAGLGGSLLLPPGSAAHVPGDQA